MVWLWIVCCICLLGSNLYIFMKKRRMLDCMRQLLIGEDGSEVFQRYGKGIFNEEERAVIKQLCNYFYETSIADVMKNEAEMHALQNQINPHFLYNTLEVIRSRAMSYGNYDVAEMVEALGLQFRYCINRFGEMATLQQELDHVKNYLLIQKYRLGDRYQFRTIIEEEEKVLSCRFPVLTLQPIIENALSHGISPLLEGGTIELKVQLAGSRVQITVEDNGIGMSKGELQKIRRSLNETDEMAVQTTEKTQRGIALKNVNKRIRFYYGEKYGLDITSTEGVGTTVFITIPIIME